MDHVDTLSHALKSMEKEYYDIVISDILLPDSDGQKTFDAVTDNAGNTPILFMTGNYDESFGIKAIKKGA